MYESLYLIPKTNSQTHKSQEEDYSTVLKKKK